MARKCFWSQFFAVAEIRCRKDQKAVDGAELQLLTQCLNILDEQADRLFVVGFILCKKSFGLYSLDRAGVLTTGEWIDIVTPSVKFCYALVNIMINSWHRHQGRRQFLHAMISLARGNSQQVGWDTTMKVNKSPIPLQDLSNISGLTEETFVNSYDCDIGKWTLDSSYRDIWMVSMPSAPSSPNHGSDRENYVLFELLSHTSAFQLSDRGAIAWKAIKLGDRQRKVCLFMMPVYRTLLMLAPDICHQTKLKGEE